MNEETQTLITELCNGMTKHEKLEKVLTELNNREKGGELIIAAKEGLNLDSQASFGIDFLDGFNASHYLPTKLVMRKVSGEIKDCEFVIAIDGKAITENLVTTGIENIHVSVDGAVFALTGQKRLILDGGLGIDILTANGGDCVVDALIYGIKL